MNPEQLVRSSGFSMSDMLPPEVVAKLKTIPQTAENVVRGVGKTTGVNDFIGGAAQNITSTPKFIANVATGKTKIVPTSELKNYNQDPTELLARQGAERMFYKGTPKVALSGLGVLSGAAPVAAAVGGALGGAVAQMDNRDVATGVGEGIGQGIRAAGVNKVLSPVVNPISQGMGNIAGQTLARAGGSNIAGTQVVGQAGQVIGNAVGQGVGNVAENSLENELTGSPQNTANQNVGNFLMGAFFGGADGLKDLNIDSAGFLRNKAGRMFDPLSGRFVEATEKVAKTQSEFVNMIGGSDVNFNAPTTWSNTPTGLVKVNKAPSRLK